MLPQVWVHPHPVLHLNSTILGCGLGGGGIHEKMSRKASGRPKRPACIAGVRVVLPNRSEECGRMKL
jgi:hypothetical protein